MFYNENTLFDKFARETMTILLNRRDAGDVDSKELAQQAYKMADAMMKARREYLLTPDEWEVEEQGRQSVDQIIPNLPMATLQRILHTPLSDFGSYEKAFSTIKKWATDAVVRELNYKS